MNLQLTPELEQLIQRRVTSGRYRSASDVIREALALMEERDQMLVLQKDRIRKQIDEGLESLRLGKGVDGEAVFDRIDSELEALERNGNE